MRLSAAMLASTVLAVAAPALRAQEPADPAARVPDLQAEVTRLRGLEFTSDVTAEVYSEAELRERIREELDEGLPEAKAKDVARALEAFGLIPAGLDLRKALLELMTSQIAGFYDPRSKELCLIRRRGAGLERLLGTMMQRLYGKSVDDLYLLHELTHAAQDQRWRLDTYPMEAEHDDDLVLALKCLVEGDATLAMYDWLAPGGAEAVAGQGALSQLNQIPGAAGKLPAVLRETLVFPYTGGLSFVVAVKKARGGSWKAVDALFDDPPASTEQILHPEKYLAEARDFPMRLDLPDPAKTLGADWRELDRNVVGELGTRILLKEFKVGKAESCAAGWDGDAYRVWARGDDGLALIWMTTWDSEDDASDFFAGAREMLEAKHPEREGAAMRGSALRFRAGKRQVRLERKGKDVLLVEAGVDEKTAADLATAVWRGTRRSERKTVERVTPKPPKPRKPRPGETLAWADGPAVRLAPGRGVRPEGRGAKRFLAPAGMETVVEVRRLPAGDPAKAVDAGQASWRERMNEFTARGGFDETFGGRPARVAAFEGVAEGPGKVSVALVAVKGEAAVYLFTQVSPTAEAKEGYEILSGWLKGFKEESK